MTLRTEDISWTVGTAPIVHGVPLRLPDAGVLALVEQQATTEVALTAREVVALGRLPLRRAAPGKPGRSATKPPSSRPCIAPA